MSALRRRRAVAVACVLGALLAVPADARAADELGLSRDGSTWSDRIETPLFDQSVLWVPGDARTETFYVRNQGSDRARLAVDLRAGGDPAWVSADGLDVSATVSGQATPAAVVGSGWRLTTARAVPAGEVLAVAVTVALPASVTDVTQERTVQADFRVMLAEDVPGTGGGAGAGGAGGGGGGDGDGGSGGGAGGPDGGGSGGGGSGATGDGAGTGSSADDAATPSNGAPAWLPGTGGPPGWVLLLGGLLLGAGSALLRAPRTDHDQHLDQQRRT